MEKQKRIALWLGKSFLVFLMFFSQMYAPLEVLAEEVNTGDDTVEKVDSNTDDTKLVDDSSNLNEKDVTNSEDTNLEDKSDVSSNNVEEKVDTNKETEVVNNENTTATEVGNEDNTNKENDATNVENTDNNTDDTTVTNENNDVTNETITDNTTVTEDTTPEEENNKYTYKVTVNGEEVSEYTLSGDTKSVTIHQEYDGEEGSYHFSDDESKVLDYSNKLYGDYHLTYSVLSSDDNVIDTRDIVIHYVGDNSEILSGYANEISVDSNIIMLEVTNKKYKVEDIISHFDTENLQNDYNARLVFKNGDGEEIGLTDEVDNLTSISLTNDEVSSYFMLVIVGDMNYDGVMDLEDAKIMVDLALDKEAVDEEGEPYFSILDATNSVFSTGVWDKGPGVHDELSHTLTNRVDIYKGEEVDVKYAISGFKEDVLNGIQGKINYNKEILELVGIEVNSVIYGNYNDEGKFAYLLDNYSSEDVLLTIKFKGIGIGESNVSIENIVASVMGDKANLGDSVFTTINVSEAGVGGDTEEDTTDNTSTTTNNNVTTVPPVVSVPNTYNYGSSYYKEIALSSDSLIKSLIIKGYEIDFDPHKFDYAIKVKNSVKSLDLEVILNDSNASYEVIGNENFKVGENTVKIVVTAEDGSTSTYTIKVDRKKASEEVEQEENKSSKAVIIILIVLVIIGLIYVIFKDDEEEDK